MIFSLSSPGGVQLDARVDVSITVTEVATALQTWAVDGPRGVYEGPKVSLDTARVGQCIKPVIEGGVAVSDRTLVTETIQTLITNDITGIVEFINYVNNYEWMRE